MIKVSITGGLGNQMFQYATGKAISLLNKTDLVLDTTWYNNYGKRVTRNFELDKFNIKSSISSGYLSGFFRKILIKAGVIKVFREKEIYKFDPNVLEINDEYIQGYWQNEKYFKDFIDVIREDFTLRNKPSDKFIEMKNKIEDSNSISIHIRRGDYISNQEANNFHGSCSIDYYTEAINIIKGKVSNPIFFVFSDDIAWVKENLKSDIVATWVSEYNLDNTEDLLLMSFCKHQIIANSSFSWWGAYLNRNINKIVIAPKKWIANKGYNTDEITPSSWIKL